MANAMDCLGASSASSLIHEDTIGGVQLVLDCYDYYLWSSGELTVPFEPIYESAHETQIEEIAAHE